MSCMRCNHCLAWTPYRYFRIPYCDAHSHHAPADGGRPPHFVYYLTSADEPGLVKIGFTNSMPRRYAAHPDRLIVLATEPGGRVVEGERHSQFASLRVHGEWFTLAGPLASWITSLAA